MPAELFPETVKPSGSRSFRCQHGFRRQSALNLVHRPILLPVFTSVMGFITRHMERERETHTHTGGKPGRKRKGQSNSTMSSVAVADVLRTSSGAYTTGLLPSSPHSRILRIIRPLSHRAYTADQTLHLTSACAEQAQVCQSLFVYRRHSCRRSCHTEA